MTRINCKDGSTLIINSWSFGLKGWWANKDNKGGWMVAFGDWGYILRDRKRGIQSGTFK